MITKIYAVTKDKEGNNEIRETRITKLTIPLTKLFFSYEHSGPCRCIPTHIDSLYVPKAEDMVVKIAGLGEMTAFRALDIYDVSFYENIEEAKKASWAFFIRKDPNKEQPEKIEIDAKKLGCSFRFSRLLDLVDPDIASIKTGWFGSYRLYPIITGFVWNGTSAHSESISSNIDLINERIIITDKRRFYSTVEECESNNEVKLFTLEDDEPKKYKVQIGYESRGEIEVEASNEDEAYEKALNIINDLSTKQSSDFQDQLSMSQNETKHIVTKIK